MHASGIIDFSQHANHKISLPLAADARTQQGFIDERSSLLIPTDVDSSRIAEDERGDEMSEPTQITRAEKRKEIHSDGSVKGLQASLPITASSHASSLRLDDETQEKLVRLFATRARTTKKGVDTLQDGIFSVPERAL